MIWLLLSRTCSLTLQLVLTYDLTVAQQDKQSYFTAYLDLWFGCCSARHAVLLYSLYWPMIWLLLSRTCSLTLQLILTYDLAVAQQDMQSYLTAYIDLWFGCCSAGHVVLLYSLYWPMIWLLLSRTFSLTSQLILTYDLAVAQQNMQSYFTAYFDLWFGYCSAGHAFLLYSLSWSLIWLLLSRTSSLTLQLILTYDLAVAQQDMKSYLMQNFLMTLL